MKTKQDTFVSKKYGKAVILHIGQKVECTYYHEHPRWYMKEAYKRKWWQLFDKPFKPVKLGIIVGDAGTHPYWMAANGKDEQYLFVKFNEYFFAKPIPISCIYDASLSAKRMAAFLKENEHRVGEPGYDLASYEILKEQMNRASNY